jgi:exonuclease III
MSLRQPKVCLRSYLYVLLTNVISTADIKNDKSNWNKSAGYTEIETTAWRETLNPTQPERKKLIDVWRQLHPDDKAYSYFSFKFQAREKGIGWRLDMGKCFFMFSCVRSRLTPLFDSRGE